MKSNEIIFLDTEFSSLNPNKGEILSIGLVKEDGEELYLELEYEGEVDEWPQKNILPTLKDKKVSREEAKRRIREFVGPDEPIAMASVNQFDMLYLYKLFTVDDCPFLWLPLDFASIFYALGYNPLEDCEAQKLSSLFGIDAGKYRQHHALDDARLLREIYLRLRDRIR